MEKIRVKNEEETKVLAERLAGEAKPGDVIGLTGDLGAGKTTFTRYMARALGIESNITSPTFAIIKEYRQGKMPLYHFDVYRLSDIDEMFQLGYEEYFYGNGLTVVEWADTVEDIMPDETLWINIESAGEQERIYTINR